MAKEELDAMVAEEEKRLGVGSEEFVRRHNEIMDQLDQIERREEEKRKAMAKQIVTVKDVMEVLQVSESKAYGVIRQLNSELKAQGYIVIPGKVPTAYFEQKCFGVKVDAG